MKTIFLCRRPLVTAIICQVISIAFASRKSQVASTKYGSSPGSGNLFPIMRLAPSLAVEEAFPGAGRGFVLVDKKGVGLNPAVPSEAVHSDMPSARYRRDRGKMPDRVLPWRAGIRQETVMVCV